MPISPNEFRDALSRFASGVTVVTTRDRDDTLHGITVSAFSSVSLSPPLVAVIIEKTAGSHHAFMDSGIFAVNILSSEQAGLSDHFAFTHHNKFEGVEYSINEDGLPWLDESLVNMSCRLRHSFDGGDHTIFVGEVIASRTSDRGSLVYFRGGYHTVSHDDE